MLEGLQQGSGEAQLCKRRHRGIETRRHGVIRSGRVQQQLARRAPPGDVLVRPAHLAHRIDRADLGLELAARRAREQVLERRLHHLAPLQAVVEPEAHDRAAGLQQRRVGHAHLLARRVSVGHQAAERRQRLQALLEHAPAGGLQHHVHGLTAVRLDQRAGQVLRGRVHGGVRAQLERALAALGRARGGDHPARAHRLRELGGQAAHAAGGRVHHHALPLRQPRGRAQQVPGGQSLDQQCQGGLVAQSVGDREHARGRRRHQLRVPAGVEQGHHPLPAGGAGHLAAEHERRLALGHVLALALVGVAEVDPRARDLHQHLARPRLGVRHVGDPEHLRPPELLDQHGSHRGQATFRDVRRLVLLTIAARPARYRSGQRGEGHARRLGAARAVGHRLPARTQRRRPGGRANHRADHPHRPSRRAQARGDARAGRGHGRRRGRPARPGGVAELLARQARLRLLHQRRRQPDRALPAGRPRAHRPHRLAARVQPQRRPAGVRARPQALRQRRATPATPPSPSNATRSTARSCG